MKHDLTVSGSEYRLRPIALEDAEFVVNLRTDSTRNRFINYTPPDVERQKKWIERYFEIPNDYYFIVENVSTKEREGTIGIYDISATNRTGEWGRWVLRPGSKAGLASLVLIFRAAFENLELDALRTRTVVDNRSVIAILERAGMHAIQRLRGYVQIGNNSYDVVEHQITRAEWLQHRSSRTRSLS